MAKIIDRVKEKLSDDLFTNEDIDLVLEQEKYYPVESDDEEEDGVFKYSNGKSQIWIAYVRDGEDLMVTNVTMSTKKKGNTEVRPFRAVAEIKHMMDWFRENEQYDNFMTFMLGLFLARRVGDTLSLKWSDFYYENGRKKEILNTLVEQKTGKTVNMHISDVVFKYLDWYCEKTGVNPMKNLDRDIFCGKQKAELPERYSEKEYEKAVKKQAAAYRNQFKKAARAYGMEDVSTHSTRKSFGYIAHELNRFDPDCLYVEQSIFGHDSLETTKTYTGIMDEKAKKMFNDVANYVYDIDNGITTVIDNMPVIALKTNDLRDIIMRAFTIGRENNNMSDMEVLNILITMAEERRVS